MNKGVIILGDPHIGAATNIGKTVLGQQFNSRVIDQLNLLDWVLTQAENELIHDIIITGDVFEDPNPEPHLLAAFLNWLSRCALYNINVHIIMGNHDFVRLGGHYRSSLDVIIEANMDNVHVYKNIETIFIGDVAYTLMPYRDRKSIGTSSNLEAVEHICNILSYEKLSIPNTYKKVVVGHLAIEGSIPVGNEIDDMTNELFFKISDFNGYDYVWMGHVHKPQVMNKCNPYVAHVGSMDISNFGETSQSKHVICFNIDDENIFKKLTLPTRQLKKITINVPDGIEDTTEYVISRIKKEKRMPNSIVKIDIMLDGVELKSVNKNKLEKEILKKGVFSVSNISESKKSSVIKKNINHVIDTKMDIKSAIDMFATVYIDKDKRSGFKQLANQLFLEVK